MKVLVLTLAIIMGTTLSMTIGFWDKPFDLEKDAMAYNTSTKNSGNS